jgi:hypothetical protein
MLYHMPHPGTFFYPLEKSTGFAHTAAMLMNCGQRFCKPLIKSLDHIGGEFFQIANVQQHLNAGAEAPVIRP